MNCTIENCERLVKARGWCVAHYSRFLRHGDPEAGGPLKVAYGCGPCSEDGCDTPSRALGLCIKHYQRQKRQKEAETRAKGGTMTVINPFPINPMGDWVSDGACGGMDSAIFFPPQGEGRAYEAKEVCVSCPVRRECLDYAVDTREKHGIWGAATEGERRQLRYAKRKDRYELETERHFRKAYSQVQAWHRDQMEDATPAESGGAAA